MAHQQFNDDNLRTKPIQKSEFSDNGSVEPPKEFGISKKAKRIGKASTIVFTLVGAGLIIGGVLEYTLAYKPTAVVEVFDVEATQTAINYEIVIKNMNVEAVTLKVYNQFTNRSTQITMGENVGSFVDLASGMEYTVSILEKDITVKKLKITTLL